MKELFSFKGRASRKEFWLIILVGGFIGGFISGMLDLADPVLGLIALIPTYWIVYAAAARRLHAINMCGWWSLVPFVSLYSGFAKDKSEEEVQDKYK